MKEHSIPLKKNIILESVEAQNTQLQDELGDGGEKMEESNSDGVFWDGKSVCFVLWGWPLSQRREGKHEKRWPVLLAKLLAASSSSSSSSLLLICKWFIMRNCVPVSNNIAPDQRPSAHSALHLCTEHQCKKVHAAWSCKPVNLILTSKQFNNADSCVGAFFVF